MGAEIIVYLGLMAFLTYMVHAFLYKLNFYRQWHTLWFYICSYAVIISRLVYFSLVIAYVNRESGTQKTIKTVYWMCSYLKCIMGAI